MQNFDPINTPLSKGVNIIEASAGTGKTYTIAMLVLRFIVERELDISTILVVTFTKAATEELKARIRSRLVDARAAMSSPTENDDPLIVRWLTSLPIDNALILERINHALLDIDQAGIFTIHGFCQRILSEHALESGQLFDAELTDDFSSIQQSCSDDFWRTHIYPCNAWEASLLTAEFKTPDQLLASVNYIPAHLTVLPEYIDIKQKLIALVDVINEQKVSVNKTLLTIEIALNDGKFKGSFSDTFQNNRQAILDCLNQKSTDCPNFYQFTQKGLTESLHGNKFRKSNANPDAPEVQKQHYLKGLNIDCSAVEVCDKAVKDITLTLRRSLLYVLQEEVSKRLLQLNLLSFDDLINRLVEGLQGDKGMALKEEINARFHVALIDEFQDTDKNQWFIFSTLFNSDAHFLYLIGDPKQAIYKFRGADINTYYSAKKLATHQFSLGSNWRSQPTLVEGVNYLFARDNPFQSKQLLFNPVDAGLSTADGTLFLKGQLAPPLVLWQLGNAEKGYWGSGKATEVIQIAIVNEIVDLLLAGFIVKHEGKVAIKPKDIAILVRTNTQAQAFQKALNQVNITAVINGKMSVFASAEASDLYFLLQAINQPANNDLLKQALSLDWFNLKGQQLFHIINDELALEAWLARFLDYQQLWKRKGLMAMMQHLLAVEKVLPYLSITVLAERRITNLQHCIELVQQAAIEEHLAINKVLDWLATNISRAIESGKMTSDEQQLRLESDGDAVKIITMHSAKGLEYPVVFCPFLWQRGGQLKKEKWRINCQLNDEMIVDLGSEQFEYHRKLALDEELQEDLRVLYVAVTRAKYRCYLNWVDVRTSALENDSAMASLLAFSGADFCAQQIKLQDFSKTYPAVFEYRLLDKEQSNDASWQSASLCPTLSCQHKAKPHYSCWQMSSYSALSSLSVHEAEEIPNDKVREEEQVKTVLLDYTELPMGAAMGNVIHDLLEHIPFAYLAQTNDISEQREKSCFRYGVKTDVPEKIDLLLNHTVNTSIVLGDDYFSLRQLTREHCLKEMPFYLSMKKLDVSQINTVLSDCPTYQTLTKKTMRGFLTGFIDLICQHNGKFYLIDYKSNTLENYDTEALVYAMRGHNYGLQYWIYSVVLHQYLKDRVAGYHYETHFGGVLYLFVRGMNKAVDDSGVYHAKPAFSEIKKLAELFL